jgi:basic membrane lipoprotein Med (substrate-binding protein (PBP1-ABC) superfamily)
MKTKRIFWVLISLLIISSFALAACGGAASEAPPAEEEVMEKKFKACQVTDTGGIDDKSFNASAWKGVEDAIAEYGIEGYYLESQQQTDYEANITAFLEQECDVIIPVGYLLADATVAAAEANPDVPFVIVDVNWLAADNIMGSGFAMNEGTFLTGYLAAGMTETGVVGTYGGMNIPPVTVFMDGYVLGVQKYNEVHGTDVKVLGWDFDAQDGLFTGNFESTDDGRTLSESMFDEDADIFMPVGGQIGAGTLALLEDFDTGYLIGVDRDWTIDYTTQADYILASAYKGIDKFVFDQITAVMNGTFTAGNLAGDIANEHVDIIYGHAVEDKIPAELKAEIEDLKAQIASGALVIPLAVPPAAEEEVALPDLDGREITIAVENAYLPYNYIDPDTGEPAGWDYDVWDAICELLNCKPTYVEASWEGLIQAVGNGQFDAAADGITITEERAELVDFSMGYMAIEQRLLVRIDEDRFETIEDIVADETLKLGTQTGTTNYETAATYLPEERIQAFEQFPFAVQALIAGDIDAVMIDETAGLGYMGANADKVHIVGPSMSSDLLGFIYPKGSDLVAPVDLAITELWENGTMEEINAYYFSPDFPITYEMLD